MPVVPPVDPRLAAIIARVESGGSGDRWAMRFEPGIYSGWPFDRAMTAAQGANRCSNPTARAICAISWGRYQTLGYNLYLDGYQGPVGGFLASEPDQLAALATFLTLRNINWSWDEMAGDSYKLDTFAMKYNGPGNVDGYIARMRAADDDLH